MNQMIFLTDAAKKRLVRLANCSRQSMSAWISERINNEYNFITCPDCGGRLVTDTTGSMTFSGGEVGDNLVDHLVCTSCGWVD